MYKLGSLFLPDYEAQLSEFATVAFPKGTTERLKDGLKRYLDTTTEDTRKDWDEYKRVWQTDKDTRHSDSSEVESWRGSLARDEGWSWDLLTDQYDLFFSRLSVLMSAVLGKQTIGSQNPLEAAE